ncbi:MAG: molybdopterin-dependent oxidoreductase FAD-binding subunit [Anaerolineae bacterium]
MTRLSGYYRPRSLEEAVKLLSQPHIRSVLLSGGALRLGSDRDPDYEAVIDVQDIPELARIEIRDGVLHIGGACTLQQVVEHPRVPAMLTQAIRRVVVPNRRNAISIAEVLEYPHELPELIAALLALDATLSFAFPETRPIKLAALGSQLPELQLPHKGLIAAVMLPAVTPRHGWGIAHVARTPADLAIVCAAVVVQLGADGSVQEARLALSGVWPEPARVADQASNMLLGKPLDEAAIEAAVDALAGEVAPVADYRGSVAYRHEMAGVLARRALLACREDLSN